MRSVRDFSAFLSNHWTIRRVKLFFVDREIIGVHESIDEEAEEDLESDEVPEIEDEEYKLVEIVKPLDCIDKSLIRSKSPSPKVRLRQKKTPESTPPGILSLTSSNENMF